jgi:hypothetical protein
VTGLTGAAGSDGATGAAGPQGQTGAAGSDGATGAAGPQGQTGASGPQGLQGVQGSTGATGPQGTAGTTGAAGATGPQGTAGTTGATGAAGPQGTAGTAGAQGSAGSAGATGAQGPAGPADGLSDYGYVYNEGAQTVPIEADVAFDSNGVLTPGISHAPGSTQLEVTTPGDYKVSFVLSGVEPDQMSLFLNGAPLAGTVYGSGAGTQQTNGQAIVTLGAGDVVTVRNHSSASAVTLQTLAGGTQTNVNASVVIEKLGT